MQITSNMNTCYHMKIMFSSSYEIAAAFASELEKRDDVWNVKRDGMDISCVAYNSSAIRKFAHSFESEWLERKIAEAEAALSASMPSPSVDLAAEVVEAESIEAVDAVSDSAVPLAATVGIEQEGYLLGIEDGAEASEDDVEEEGLAEDFEEGTPR